MRARLCAVPDEGCSGDNTREAQFDLNVMTLQDDDSRHDFTALPEFRLDQQTTPTGWTNTLPGFTCWASHELVTGDDRSLKGGVLPSNSVLIYGEGTTSPSSGLESISSELADYENPRS